MAALVLDADALIALDRGDRKLGALLALAARDDHEVLTSSACVAQVWRDPAGQARLTRALGGIVEWPLDKLAARRCGLLLGRSDTRDVVDAALALLVQSGDTVLTSDPDDLARLLNAADVDARIRAV
jgi:hypothetical protein